MLKKFPQLLLFFTTTLFGQNHSAEVGIVLDNDLFVSTVNDKYYTNGIELFYRYLSNFSSEKIIKKTTELRFGQKIFNPYTVEAKNIRKHDRPFAGFLYAEVATTNFYQNNSLFKFGGQAGIVGPSSGGEAFQKLFHRTFGYKKVEGWEFQIRDILALQINSAYAKTLASGTKIDFHAAANATVGTVFTGISAGPIARFSLYKELLPMHNSALFNASLQTEKENYKNQREFFFYVNPSLNYQLYDATIQGSLFNENSPVTYDLIPFRFNAEAGFRYRHNHWNFHYLFMYRGKELSNNRIESHFYGQIGASYLLY